MTRKTFGWRTRCAGLWTLLAVSWAPTAARAADFYSVVDQIVAADYQLKAQASQSAGADERDKMSRTRYLPMINANADQTSDEHTAGAFYVPSTHGRSVSVSATWNLFRSGGDGAEVALRRQVAVAAHATQDDLRLGTEATAATLVVDLLAAEARVRALETMTQAAHATTQNAERLFQASRLSRRDQQRLKAAELSLAARLASFSDAVKIAAAKLQSRAPTARVDGGWPFVAVFADSAKLERQLQQIDARHALTAHPKFLAANAQAEHAATQITATRAKLGPSLDAGYAWKRQQYYDQHFFDNETTATLTLTIPLVSPESPWVEAAALAHERQAAEDKAADVERQLDEARAAAHQALIGEARHIGAQMQAVQAYRDVLADSRHLFTLGQVSSVDLAVDEQAVFEAELDLIDRWYNAHTSTIAYCGAIGVALRECVPLLSAAAAAG